MFEQIHKHLTNELEKAFKNVSVFSEYPDVKALADSPAIFFECTNMDLKSNDGNGNIDLDTRWEIRHFIPISQDNHAVAARSVAAKIAVLLHNKPWSEETHPAKYLGSDDENYDVREKSFEVWVSHFNLTIRTGPSDWGKFDFYFENTNFPEVDDKGHHFKNSATLAFGGDPNRRGGEE